MATPNIRWACWALTAAFPLILGLRHLREKAITVAEKGWAKYLEERNGVAGVRERMVLEQSKDAEDEVMPECIPVAMIRHWEGMHWSA
jgi:hypothetical protein